MDGTHGPTGPRPREESPGAGSRTWLWFLAWLLIGAAGSLSLLTIPTVGLYLLPLSAAAAGVAAFRPGARPGLPGLLSGAGLPLLYVAFLNRRGPGTVCTGTATAESCVDEWNPWLWWAGGVALLVAGALWLVLADRARSATVSRPGPVRGWDSSR